MTNTECPDCQCNQTRAMTDIGSGEVFVACAECGMLLEVILVVEQ